MKIREAIIEDFKQMNNIFKQVDGFHSDAHPELFNKPMIMQDLSSI